MSEREVTLTRIARWTDRGGSTSPAGHAALDSEKAAAGLATEADDPQACPMSSGQMRVWFTEQVMGVSAANNLSVGLRLSGALDTAVLELGLRIVVGRHEIL